MILEFYEKPGCINNAKQRELLEAAGHSLHLYSILDTEWTEKTLRPFFGVLSVKEWFNQASPRVKSGEIIPEELDEATAMKLMLSDHLLIRRPLIYAEENYVCGFNNLLIKLLLGNLDLSETEKCTRAETVC